MGVFDTLHLRCTNCGGNISIQSKAGPCCLADYSLVTAPMSVISDVDGETVYCPDCEMVFVIEVEMMLYLKRKPQYEG